MAHATHLTIGTADRIRLSATGSDENLEDEVRQEVQVSITYALEAGDTDLAALAEDKAAEVQRAHERAWHRIGALSPRVPSCSCHQEDREDSGQMRTGLTTTPWAGRSRLGMSRRWAVHHSAVRHPALRRGRTRLRHPARNAGTATAHPSRRRNRTWNP